MGNENFHYDVGKDGVISEMMRQMEELRARKIEYLEETRVCVGKWKTTDPRGTKYVVSFEFYSELTDQAEETIAVVGQELWVSLTKVGRSVNGHGVNGNGVGGLE